jgi:hypothetical protein
MPKSHYNRDIRVPESVIQEIRELGMEAALKKARSGTASQEFVEGVSRFYPNQWRDEDKDQYLEQGPLDEEALADFQQSQGQTSAPSPQPQRQVHGPTAEEHMPIAGLRDAAQRRMSPEDLPVSDVPTDIRPNYVSPGSPGVARATEPTDVRGAIRKLLELATAPGNAVMGAVRGMGSQPATPKHLPGQGPR